MPFLIYFKYDLIIRTVKGNTFCIIKNGICNVYQKSDGEQILINQMSQYDHFGEKALRESHEVRTASVQVNSLEYTSTDPESEAAARCFSFARLFRGSTTAAVVRPLANITIYQKLNGI
jgi:CRP-like cAMP-binding protein